MRAKHTRLTVEANDPTRAGERASNVRIIFGEFHRFRVQAVEWMVTEQILDELEGAL